MLKNYVHRWSALLCLCLLPNLCFSKRVHLRPVEGQHIEPEVRESTRDALMTFLSDEGLNVVKTPNEGDAISSFIEIQMTPLGDFTLINLRHYEVGTGQLIHSDHLGTRSDTNLVNALARLARSLASGKKSTESVNEYALTERYDMVLKPQESSFTFGLGVGGLVSSGHKGTSVSGINLSMLWDDQNILLITDAALYAIDDTLDMAQLGVGCFYAFSQRPSTLYLGAGLALTSLTETTMPSDDPPAHEETSTSLNHHHHDIEETRSGLSVFGALGWLAGRSRKVTMRPEIGYQVAGFTLNGHRLHGPRVSVSVGF